MDSRSFALKRRVSLLCFFEVYRREEDSGATKICFYEFNQEKIWNERKTFPVFLLNRERVSVVEGGVFSKLRVFFEFFSKLN